MVAQAFDSDRKTRLGYPNSDQNQTTKEWGSGI